MRIGESQQTFEDIHRLIKVGDRIGVRAWLSEGGDANLRNRFGWSLLMLAALHGRTDVAEDLLAAGADAHVTNDFGNTAVGLARLKSHARTAEAIERAMVRDGV